MIQITQKLIHLNRHNNRLDAGIVSAYADIIAKYGSIDDAIALAQWFLESPADFNGSLLYPIMKHGNEKLAKELHNNCFYHNELREGIPDDILHVLGYLGFTDCTEQLISYMEADDWGLSMSACMGLLHLPCDPYKDLIKSKLEKWVGQSLFHEFLPALSFKCAAPEIVPRLADWGEHAASTDCNAGIILGIALFGTGQKDVLKHILWSPNWEAHGTGTGTCIWSYVSMQHVGLTFKELIGDIKHAPVFMEDRTELDYRLDVLYEMLSLKLTYHKQPIRFACQNNESIREIYQDLFSWPTPHKDESIIGLIIDHFGLQNSLLEKYYELRNRFELKIDHEIELEHLLHEY
ncbi:hypothetical protein LQV63_05370 [Paenibacillus profundus]|uniref:Uncharacterized protein n=1 Tax=Paenibacillus profundus TaxID=1173085 RepID=A0ABS8YEH1_9BACL|nr:hypothetical protein [Paenibacillus profundus]MCE5168741.1 hypothetical protein [Paenibacillus profundus]